ncbi:MAG: hypothetical protein MH321_14065 [Leptospiraceae bacterium]|nr:hypothetical protein [Leptospiraceae bacterium]
MKQILITFFICVLTLINCGSLNTRDPFFQAEASQNLSSEFEIELVDLGLYRKINGDWWGEDFFVSTFLITNKTNLYKFYNLCDDKLEERNFKYTVGNQKNRDNYAISPEKFDKAGFLKGYPEMKLIVEISDPNLWPTAKYGSKFVFPKIQNSKNEFVAAMTACKYGVPMSRDTDRGSTSSGWIAPNQKETIKTIYSIPKGANLLRFEQEQYFKAQLKEFVKKK